MFALYRLANNLEDPPTSKVRGLLKKAKTFKGAMLPVNAKPILMPVLAYASLTKNVRSCLRSMNIDRKDFLTPFIFLYVQ